jgi:hypothetical protein
MQRDIDVPVSDGSQITTSIHDLAHRITHMMSPYPPTTGHPPLDAALGEAGNAEPIPDDAAELTQARLMTFLPAELLQGGEAILLLLKPSPWYILLESLHFLVAMVITLGLALWAYNHGYNLGITPRDLALLGLGLGGVRLFWQFLEWLSRVYVLTDRRVIRVKGVIRVQVFETQFQQVQHTTTTFCLRERLLGLGSIHIATAGTGSIEASWVMLSRPLDVHRTVVQALNRYR